MREADLGAVDHVMRLAFGTFLGIPDPLQFMGDTAFARTRWKADPSAAFCAQDGDRIVGSVFVGNWGSVGFFGPLTIHPDYWNGGVAQLLMRQVMECFGRWGTRHMGLYTFPTSMKHLGLYRKFGFWPRCLTISMEKKVEVAGVGVKVAAEASMGVDVGAGLVTWTRFSDVPADGREGMIDRCRAVTGKVLEGLDVGVEIRSVAGQRLGETVLLWAEDELAGFAVCHCGAGTEAGSGVCYIKFAAVRLGSFAGMSADESGSMSAEVEFRRLLVACEQLAAERGLEKVSGGVNTARQEAWAAMLVSGWRGIMAGVAMQGLEEPGYNRPGVFLIDDWR